MCESVLEGCGVPIEIPMKLRDKVCYRGGVKVAFEDMTKFVLTADGKYCVGPAIGQAVEGKVIDMLPFICVGMAVTPTVRDSISPDELSDYYRDLMEDVQGYTSYREAIAIYNSIVDEKLDTEHIVNVAYSLGSYRKDFLFTQEREVACSFLALALINRKEFVKVLFKSMKYLLDLMIMDHTSLSDIYGVSGLGDSGMFEYKLHMGSRRLTDARGVGFGLLKLLTAHIYTKFGELRSIFLEEMGDAYDNLISSCIGSDIAGRYLKGRGFAPAFGKDTVGVTSVGYASFEPHKRQDLDGNCFVYRESYENYLSWLQTYGLSEEYYAGKSYACPNMRWFDPATMEKELAYFAFASGGFKSDLDSVDSARDAALKRVSVLEANLAELQKQQSLNLRKKEEELNQSYVMELEKLQAKIQDLEWQLSEKAAVTERLSLELTDLKSNMANCFFSDVPDDDETEEEVSVGMEEMIQYISNFHFLIVGGDNSLFTRLSELGWTENLSKMEAVVANYSTLPHADFVILNTQFIAHKTVYLVNSKFGREVTMYYNGTNVEQLVRSAYKFAKHYIEGGTL